MFEVQQRKHTPVRYEKNRNKDFIRILSVIKPKCEQPLFIILVALSRTGTAGPDFFYATSIIKQASK